MKRVNLWSVKKKDVNGVWTAEDVPSVDSAETENLLESLLVDSPRLLMEGLTLIGRQVPTEGGPLDLGLQMGPDGKVYGFTSTCIYRLDRSTLKCEIVTSVEDGISVAGPILGSDIYFGTNHRLRAIGLFQG